MATARDHSDSDSEWEESEDEDDYEWSDGASVASVDDEDDGEDCEVDDSVPACCNKECLRKKTGKYRALTASLTAMSRAERVTAILTAISMSALFAAEQTDVEASTAAVRDRFVYYVPVLGRVCKDGLQKVFSISHRTFTLYRKRALNDAVNAKPHGNLGNMHAKKVDDEAVFDWLQEVAAIQGEVVGVRVRRVVKEEGLVRLVSRAENYTMLPASYTWDFLYDEFKRFLNDEFPGERVCSRRTFGRIAKDQCPRLRIRAPRDNVCDICCILRSRMPRDVTVEETEAFAKHIADARAMRTQYKQQCEEADDDELVFTIDFAQNLTLPNVPETPSMWYFMTLMSVSMFGVFCHNSNKQYNFIYSEKKAGKGSNEVISMIHRALKLEGVVSDSLPEKPRRLTVWADNCGGQNKNSFVVSYLRLLVDVGVVREANLNFLVKGHTKNACDRGFGAVKRHVMRNEAWILADLVELVNSASSGGEAVCLEDDSNAFADFKPFFEKLYKKPDGIQKYQMFRMPAEGRGLVECRTTPAPGATVIDIKHRDANFAFLLSMPLPSLWAKLLTAAPLPPGNAEKAADFHKKITPYVPTKYRDHPFYKKPSDETVERAKAVKAQRAQFRVERLRENAGEQSTSTRKRRRADGAADADEGKEEVV